MRTEIKPPEKKPRDKKSPSDPPRGSDPAQAEKVDLMPAGNVEQGSSDQPSEEEVIKPWRKPVTNQDEQDKITNAGGDNIPIPDK